MTSHEYAQKTIEQCKYLLSRPEFTMPGSDKKFMCFYDRDAFIAAVRALEPGKKEFKGADVDFMIDAVNIVLSIPRNKVCKLVTPAVYDCEPFLGPEEEAEL